jgi:hypothetical protein
MSTLLHDYSLLTKNMPIPCKIKNFRGNYRGNFRLGPAEIHTKVAGSRKKASGWHLRFCKVKREDLGKDFGHDHLAL